jgi:hypothetical protein
MSEWSLDLAGTRRTLAEWELAGGVARFNSLAVDQFSITRDGALFDADPLCAFDDTAKLFAPDGAKVFEGRRQLVQGLANGSQEAQAYLFAGPWLWLEQNLYKQLWRGGIGGVLTQLFTSHIILSGSGTNIITRVLQYAIARGAPLQIGTIDIPVAPPMSEIIDRTCATVIIDVLKYAPDAVGWFDYSTSPPTFHCRQRPALTPVTVSIPPAVPQDGVKVSLIAPIQARPDLQVPSVEINYEITNEVDGQTLYGFSRDAWPPGATGLEDGCLSSVVNLQGFSATHVRGYLNAATVDMQSLDWWAKFFPWIRNDNRVFSVSIATPATRAASDGLTSLNLPRYLLQDSGAPAPWMINPDGSDVVWDEDVFTIELDYSLYVEPPGATNAEEVTVRKYRRHRLTVPLMTVNAPAGETDYEALESFENGDPIPVGLAKFLYDSLSPLQYDALIELTEEECSGLVRLGNTVNVAGSRAEWAAMNAVVQSVTLNIDKGITSITAGPPKQLSLDDVMELLRANRARRRWTNPNTQDTGELSGPSNVQLPKATPGANSVPGQSASIYFAVKNGNSKITMDAANALFARVPVGSRSIDTRLATVCVRNAQGVTEEMYALVQMGVPFPISQLAPP